MRGGRRVAPEPVGRRLRALPVERPGDSERDPGCDDEADDGGKHETAAASPAQARLVESPTNLVVCGRWSRSGRTSRRRSGYGWRSGGNGDYFGAA